MCATRWRASKDNQGFFLLQRFLDALKLFAEYVESYSNKKEDDPEEAMVRLASPWSP